MKTTLCDSLHRTPGSTPSVSLSGIDESNMSESRDFISAPSHGTHSSQRKSPSDVLLIGNNEQPWRTRRTPTPKGKKMLRFAEEVWSDDKISGERFHDNAVLEPLDTGVVPGPLEYSKSTEDVSSLSSRDEEEFKRDLATLDADIARIQRSLRETALKT